MPVAIPSTPISTPSRTQSGRPPSTQQSQALPDYVPPSAPLNQRGQDALAALLRTYPLEDIEKRLKEANDMLIQCAGDINERLTEEKSQHQKRKARAARQAREEGSSDAPSSPHNKEEDERLEETRAKVENMTKRMDKEIRKGIDGYAYCNGLSDALKSLARTADAASTQATQIASSAITMPGSTLPPAATPAPPSLTPALKAALEAHNERYTALPLSTRYASHNDYTSFKQTVHEMSFPVDAGNVPALPHARTWFASEEGGAGPQPGVTNAHGANADDSDDDIAIDRENISTRCPITMAEFREPMKSAKCPHTFEKEAIVGLIRGTRPPTGHGRRGAWTPTCECPVPGCGQQLTEKDVVHDAVLVRRIQRLQRARARAEAEAMDESQIGGGRGRAGVEEIDSGSEEDVEDVEREAPAVSQRVKRERLKRARDEIEDD